MPVYILLAALGMIAGSVTGGLSAGPAGFTAGAAAGLIFGSLAWILLSTVAQLRRERRLNRYFEEAARQD
jgi:membrane associated rhomboid family serine protease